MRAREPDSDQEGFYEGFQVGLTQNRGGRPGWEHSIRNGPGVCFSFFIKPSLSYIWNLPPNAGDTLTLGDLDSILGVGRSPGEGNGNPLQ